RRFLPMLVVALASRVASADERAACIASADAGQDLRDRHKLVAAREQFVACASEACPAAVRKDCIQWQSDVEARLATRAVVAAGEEGGNDLADVKVSADGKPIAERLDGTSVSMDPGEHTVVFAGPGRQPARLDVIVREGEKNRQLQAVLLLERPASPAAPV